MIGAGTILVIEDDELVRLSLVAYLEDCGYRVLPAANGEEGLRVLAEERPEVILTDLRMPVLDGFGVLAALRSQGCTIPVITVTGMGDEQALAEALRLGASRCLVKPIIHLPNLVAMIETLRGAPDQGC